MVNWANDKVINKEIKQAGFEKFIDADKADIYFVALTVLEPGQYTVVTEEISAPESKNDIKLPDACKAHGVRCINFMTMLRELKVKF